MINNKCFFPFNIFTITNLVWIVSVLYNERLAETLKTNDVTQVCACCCYVRAKGRARTLTANSVGRSGKTLLLLGHGLADAEGAGNGSQVFTAFMLTVDCTSAIV